MMMQHMGINSSMKQMFADEPEIAVNCGRSATEEGEAFGGVVRESEVSVVEVGYCYFGGLRGVSCLPTFVCSQGRMGNHTTTCDRRSYGRGETEWRMKNPKLTNPMISPQIRHAIIAQHAPPAPFPPGHAQPQNHDRDPQIRNHNLLKVPRPKIRPVTAKVEMTPLPPRHAAHPLEREVVQREVDREGNQLVEEERDQGHDGRVFSEFPERQRGKGVVRLGCEMLLSRVRHEGDVFSEVVGVLVVGLVREAPGVVGREEARMQCQADGVVEPSVFA
jgi:hypothetical protein